MSDRETLHLVIVGHVDHGKSTLIGRLMVDTDSLPAEKIEEIRRASSEAGGEIDYAYVTDQLEEERAQSMTIDTAQTFFKSAKRDYAIIDAPGHKEFTRNMITGASRAEAAILVVDATEGLREQTRRHACFLAMLSIGQLAVVINKMDGVKYDEGLFGELSKGTEALLTSLGLAPNCVIPASAMHGDNIAEVSGNMAWYQGLTVMQALDSFSRNASAEDGVLRFPVQDVYSRDGEALLVGRVESGRLGVGEELVFLPSGVRANVGELKVFGAERSTAPAGLCVGIVLDPPTEVARGEIGCPPDDLPRVTSRPRANIFSMTSSPLRVGEQYALRAATQEIPCTIERIDERVDSSTLAVIEENASELAETEVGRVILSLARPAVLETFQRVRELGRIVLASGHDIVAGGIVTEVGQTHEDKPPA